MKLKTAEVTNFGSYKSLSLDFQEQGLALIFGPTGSGKSTVMDVACWLLFGETAKGGGVDEVRSWTAAGEPTEGTLEVELHDGPIHVHRKRGKAGQSDAFWTEGGDELQHRGKDLAETQKLLIKRLGVSPELYQMAAYFHEFSPSGGFFTAKAKDRRQVFEQIVSLDLPVKIASAVQENRKATKTALQESQAAYSKESGRLEQLERDLLHVGAASKSWTEKQSVLLASLQRQSDSFESVKAERLNHLIMQSEEFESTKNNLLDEMIDKVKKAKSEVKSDKKLKAAVEAIDKEIAARLEAQQLRNTEFAEACQAKANLQSKEKEHVKFSSLRAAKCPTCLGPTDNANKKKHLEEIQKEMKTLQTALDEKVAKVNQMDVQLKAGEGLSSKRSEAVQALHWNEKAAINHATLLDRLQVINDEQNPYPPQITQVESEQNPHGVRLEAEKDKENPFRAQITQLEGESKSAAQAANEIHLKVEQLEAKLASLQLVYDLSFELRGALLQQKVEDIQNNTNRILETYFDGELRVSFTLDADDLEVGLQKNGYDCVFHQLSKGQRQLLKLSFVLSIMEAAANKAGIHFSQVFLDEAFDGLDEALKIKAFRLLQELGEQHESVLVIDHAVSLQNLFSRRYEVTMVGDNSEIALVES